MTKIIIATLYEKEPVLVSATKLGADVLYLVIDDKENAKQEDSLSLIKKSLGSVVKINTIKVSVYDIVSTAKKIVDILETLSEKDDITLNISSGRKTQSLALLFAAYTRIRYVNRIIYVTQEEHKIIELPKLAFNLTESQIRLLSQINKEEHSSLVELAKKTDMSRGMLYRNLKELQDLGLIVLEKESKYRLTDAGKIARL